MTVVNGFLLPIFWSLSNLGLLEDPTPRAAPLTSPDASSVWIWKELGKGELSPPSFPVLALALNGYAQLQDKLKKPLLTDIDYSLPSTQKCLFINDLAQQKILLHTVVAHGRNSSALLA